MKNPLDSAELRAAIENVHRAGMPGVFAEVRDGDHVWRGAARGRRRRQRPSRHGRHAVRRRQHHQDFTAAAVLQQVEGGQIGLDSPISRHLPRLVPGERGDAITVRMLINHTSGLAEYLPCACPSLKAFPFRAVNLQRWNKLDSSGRPQHHPIDDALSALCQLTWGGSAARRQPSARPVRITRILLRGKERHELSA